VLSVILGLLLVARGAFWIWQMRRYFGGERKDTGARTRVAASVLALVRGVGSLVLGVAVIGRVYDLAIALAVAMVLWEVGLLRRRRARKA
jgi:hypothetical protein